MLHRRRRHTKTFRRGLPQVSNKKQCAMSSPRPPWLTYADLFDEHSSDGIQNVSRPRRVVAETGSFGKSARRSRSRTGTPAPKKEDATLAAADAIFSQYISHRAAESSEQPQRNSSLSQSINQPTSSSGRELTQIDGNAGPSSRFSKKEPPKVPTEVILRGFKPTQQYASIKEYECIAGRICEDYPRDPPVEQRRYKLDVRDPASMRLKPLTAAEKAKTLKYAGGNHWIKVTFESAEAAEAAVDASPQTILGQLIYAELYRGVPPAADEPVDASGKQRKSRSDGRIRPSRSTSTPMREINRNNHSFSPTESQASSFTVDSGTVASTDSPSTITGNSSSQSQSQPQAGSETMFCRRIPTAKRAKLLPADQALLPQSSFSKKVLASIPLIGWLSADIIGTAVPRTEMGDFDWDKASLYWKIVWWVDSMTGWFEVVGNDKDE